jgi:hypothetical protein
MTLGLLSRVLTLAGKVKPEKVGRKPQFDGAIEKIG